jgi:predicted metal-dependent hydrolase
MFQRAIRHAEGDVIQVGAAPVRLVVSARARRVSIRIDRARGEVLAVAPSARRLADAVAFAHERAAWIAARIEGLAAPTRIAPGLTLTVFGRPCVLHRAPGRASLEGDGWERGGRLPYGADDAAYAKAVAQLIKREAMTWFSPRIAHYAAAVGAPKPPLRIIDARTRWGSCTPAQKGRPASIRLSWRLALATPAVADYVAAHECAHLIHPNHGPAFWAEVKRINGDPRSHRAWLRKHGAELHAFGA